MNKLSLEKGRVKQKLQTRTEILKAAKALMNKSKKISLEDVAEKANVSRATIYRYFPNVELLFMEASLDVHTLSVDELTEIVKEKSLAESILFLQNHYNQHALQNELIFRRYLSIALSESIGSKKKIRGARRVKALKDALKPFEKTISKREMDNLIYISSILMGIDALVVSKDVCGLDNESSREVLKWGIEMVLNGLFQDGRKI